jgi:hypothetical protein
LFALAALLPLTGCAHRAKVAAVPLPPVAMVTVPPPTHPTEPLPEEPVAETPVVLPPPAPPKKPSPPRHRSTPPPVQTAVAAPPPPAPIDLGQLTTGGDATNSAAMQQTEDLMRAQQKRLIGIPTAVVALHTQQIEQARLFLRQADEAWKKLDVEGARTLSTKAKVLLDEVLE